MATAAPQPGTTRLTDLPDDMLCEILSRLPSKKLLTVERVSRDWRRCVQNVLNCVEAIGFWHWTWQHDQHQPLCNHIQQLASGRRAFVINAGDPNNSYHLNYFTFYPYLKLTSAKVDFFLRLLSRCPSIKCLDFRFVETDTNLMRLVDACPNLECLSIGHINYSHSSQFNKKLPELYAKLNSKLVHLRTYMYRPTSTLSSLISSCENLDLIEWPIPNNKTIETLNTLGNRVDISLKINESTLRVVKDQLLATIAMRAQCLSVELMCFKMIADHCRNSRFERLRFLIVRTKFTRNYNVDITINKSLSFPALEYFHIDKPTTKTVEFITDYFKFGQLKSLKITGRSDLTWSKLDWFLRRMLADNKHLKRLVFWSYKNFELGKLDGLRQFHDLTLVMLVDSDCLAASLSTIISFLEQFTSLKRLEIQLIFYYLIPSVLMKTVLTSLSRLRQKHHRIPVKFKLLAVVPYFCNKESSINSLLKWVDDVGQLPQVLAVETIEKQEYQDYGKRTYKIVVDYDKRFDCVDNSLMLPLPTLG